MSKVEDNDSFVRQIQTALKGAGCYSGDLDGWAGSLTRQAYEKGMRIIPCNDSTSGDRPSNITTSQNLYSHAWKDAGLREKPGTESAERIRLAIESAAAWLNPDDSQTAWCGCILGLWCRELNLPVPQEYYRAINWLSVGRLVTINDAQRGDIVVLTRPGGSHVGLYHTHDHTHITLLGGNQSNAVNLTRYSLASLRGIRRLLDIS